MKHWAAEFQPRSICNYGSDGDSGPSGDSGGGYTGDTGGDFFGSSDGGFYGTNDSGNFQGDTGFQGTGGDSWTGSEAGASQFASSDPGSFFGDSGPGPAGDTSSGFNYSGSDGFIGPNSDFGYSPGDGWGPTGGVDFTSSGMGFGYGPGPDAASNFGAYSNTAGPGMGWAGDFGTYGSGGPTGTGFGQGAQSASIGGPGQYGSPSGAGINGFPGDFGAPPGGAFGMPNQGDVGPQAGPGMPGGPQTTQQGEALNPSLFGPEVTSPEVTRPSDDRTQVDPSTVFGPEFATNQAAPNAGWFGPSQAQAASRGTDQDIINLSNQISNEQNMFANDFGRTGDLMAQYMATNNPGLMEAMQAAAAQSQGPMGVGLAESTQGKGDRGDTAPVSQAYPGAEQAFPSMSMYNVDPVAPSQGWPSQTETTPTVQQSGVPTVDPATMQQGYQQLAAEMNARQNQQDMMTAQEHGEQGKSGVFGVPAVDPATSKSGYDMLTQQMMEQQSNQNAPLTADMFDAQSRGEQGKGEQLAPWVQGERGPIEQQMETIGLRPGEDVISSLLPATLNAGGGIGVPGLLSMYATDRSEPSGRPGGSPTGNPSQAGVGPFGPGSGRPGGDTSGRPGLSITVGNNQYAAGRPGGPGYYQTGGAGIAPGAKGAEYGGAYGRGSPGLPGTSAFGGDFRSQGGGTGWFFDPGTGQYFQAGGRR